MEPSVHSIIVLNLKHFQQLLKTEAGYATCNVNARL
jgi:hypothetical protein